MPAAVPTQPYQLTATQIVTLLRGGALTPRELVDSLLDRIRDIDPLVRAFHGVRDDGIREWARGTGRGGGGLLGAVPVAYKTLFHTGTPHGTGTGTCAGPGRDRARLVTALDGAGAGTLGSTRAPKLFSTASPTRNPWDLTRTPGWSSGGSAAAVATGMVPVALGTDTAGSVRIPAAMCGVVGFKPTFGLLPMRGVTRMTMTLDHVGVLARGVADVALLLRAVGALPPRPATAQPRRRSGLGGVVIGLPPRTLLEPMSDEVRAANDEFTALCAELGAVLKRVPAPTVHGFGVDYRTLVDKEIARLHDHRPVDYAGHHGPGLDGAVESGRGISDRSYARAARRRASFVRAWRRVFREITVLALPTVRTPALGVDVDEVVHRDGSTEPVRSYYTATCSLFNLSLAPALTLPSPRTGTALPVGMQLVGRPGADHAVLRLGQLIDSAARRGTLPVTPPPPAPRAGGGDEGR